MNSVRDLLPKDKSDLTSIDRLTQLGDAEIEPILLPLLQWIQDINWPVAKAILPVLALHPVGLAPHILNILQPGQDDAIWKYWILCELLPLFSDEELLPILPSVQRIAKQPTPDEIAEGAADAAAALMHGKQVLYN